METILRNFGEALYPLKEAVSSLDAFKAFLYELGWDVTDLPTAYANLGTAVSDVVNTIEGLVAEPSDADLLQVAMDIKALYDAVKGLSSAPSGVDATAFLASAKDDIIKLLVTRYLDDFSPILLTILRLMGVVKYEYVAASGSRPDHYAVNFKTSHLGLLLSDPGSFVEEAFGWGTNDFDFEIIAEVLYGLMSAMGLSPSLSKDNSDLAKFPGYGKPSDGDPDPVIRLPLFSFSLLGSGESVELVIGKIPAIGALSEGIIIYPVLPSSLGTTISLGPNSDLDIRAGTNLTTQFAITIRPEGMEIHYPFGSGSALPQAGFGAKFTYDPEEPFLLLGKPGATRLEIGKLSASLNVNYLAGDFSVELELLASEARFVIQAGEGDGFLSKVIGEEEQAIDFDFGIRWSSIDGLNVIGGGGLDINIPLNLDLGPIKLPDLQISAGTAAGNTPGISIGVASTINLDLGPFHAAIKGMGASLNFFFEDGNAGPFDVKAGFKPPTGIGLSLDSDAIKGGGYLEFDYANERYVGMIELSIKDKIAVTAIGLLTTRMPDGSKGFSLLLLITAQFPPIQLGFGFTLSGVGGLIGVNRTMVLEVLRDGVRTGALESVLFPEDVVENASQIISDLRSIFPPEEGRFTFGPMGKLGWGTPTLLDMEIGLLIELPSPVRLAILGVIKAILPDEEAALIKIQVAFLGTIDFEKKFITFDASLFDSKLLTFTLEGDMAVRIKWGDNSNFVFTVGGFHPSYTPPPLELPTMRRLTLNLINKEKLRLILTTYMAVTSNTVQFGAAVDFYAKVISKVTVKGFLRFDALFQFSPFYFIVTFEAGLAVYWKSKSVMSLYLSIMLEGPTPWHAKGRAEFKVMGIKCKLKFDETWGQNANTSLPDVDVMPKLKEALTNKSNWVAGPPAKEDKLVSLRNLDGLSPTNVVAHPDSVMSVSQKVVPLNTTITQFSNQKPSDYTWFDLKLEDENAVEFDDDDVKEEFAPASYFTLNNDQKLSRPSFEKYNGGLKVRGTDEFYSDYFREREVQFERVVMDSRYVPVYDTVCIAPKTSEFNAWVRNGSASKSPLGSVKAMQSPLAPGKVNVSQAEFALVTNENLNIFEGRTAATLMEAQSILDEVLEERPELTYKLNVVPAYEIA